MNIDHTISKNLSMIAKNHGMMIRKGLERDFSLRKTGTKFWLLSGNTYLVSNVECKNKKCVTTSNP